MSDQDAASHTNKQPGSPTLSRAYLAGRADLDLAPAIELIVTSYFGNVETSLGNAIKNTLFFRITVQREQLRDVVGPDSPELTGKSYTDIKRELLGLQERLLGVGQALSLLSEPSLTVFKNAMFPVYGSIDDPEGDSPVSEEYDYLSLLIDGLELARYGKLGVDLNDSPSTSGRMNDEDYKRMKLHKDEIVRALTKPELSILLLRSAMRACLGHIDYAVRVIALPKHRPARHDLYDFVRGLSKVWVQVKGERLTAGIKAGAFGDFCQVCLWTAMPTGEPNQELEKKLQNVVKSVVRSSRASKPSSEKPT